MLVFSVILALPVPSVAQTNPKMTVYLDPPTIEGAAVGEEFMVSIMIRDAASIDAWQAGLIFDASLLYCTGFYEGEFLRSVGSTWWKAGTIDNTAGVVSAHACGLWEGTASGGGQLAYLTFKVKAPGLSDLHLRDVKVQSGLFIIPTNIIDVYTVVVDAAPHRVVTLSNSTGLTGWYHSGFYAHAYNHTLKELSFNVTGPNPGFSNVTIPKTLLNVSTLDEWKVLVDGILVDRTITENATPTSIHFTYTFGIHEIRITTYPFIGTIRVGIVGPKGWIQWDGFWEGACLARDLINKEAEFATWPGPAGILGPDGYYRLELVDIDLHAFPVPDPSATISELLTKLEANPDMLYIYGARATLWRSSWTMLRSIRGQYGSLGVWPETA